MNPTKFMRKPETPTGMAQSRDQFQNVKEHVVVLMPFGTDYGVSDVAWRQIKAHPEHRVVCKNKQGDLLAELSAAVFSTITPSGVQQVRGRTLYMIPRAEVGMLA